LIADEVNVNREAVRRMLTEELGMRKICANAPAHAAFSVAQFLTSKGITVIPRPPYSLDLAPCELLLINKSKLGNERTPF